MKHKNQLHKQFLSALVGLALVAPASLSFADTITNLVSYSDGFDIAPPNGIGQGIGREWGPGSAAWSATEGIPAGAVEINVVFDPSSDTPNTAFICKGDWGNPWNVQYPIKFSDYDTLEFDIKYDTNSDITFDEYNGTSAWRESFTNSASGGSNVWDHGTWVGTPSQLSGGGYISGNEITLCGGPAGQMAPVIASTNIPAAAASGWTHVKININKAQSQIDGVSGIVFHKWCGGTWALAYPVTARFWIDNVMLIGSSAPPPPPKVSFHPVTCKGLQLYASASAGGEPRWQRQMIRTLDTSFSWVGASYPMSYCWKICNFSPCVLNVFQTFDTGMSWENWWGLGGPSWDSGTDRWTNSASGSMKLVAPFTGASSEQFCYRWLSSLNGNQYGSLQFDIKVDPSSAPGSSGDYGSWEFGFINASWGTTPIGSTNITGLATNGWVHISLAITPSATYDATALGLYIKDWCDGYLTNTLTCWIDNLVLYAANEQMHVFFIPQGDSYTNLPYGWGDSSIDWNCKSMLFLRISQENLASPTNLASYYPGYICRIGFKTNQPSSEAMIFPNEPTNHVVGPGPIGQLCVASNNWVLGDWCLTFSDATHFTLAGPSSDNGPTVTIASGEIPSDVAQNVFNDSMSLYFGHQPNSRANIFLDAASQTLTLNRIWITSGVGTMIDDSFGAPPLDANVWATCAADPNTIWIVATNARWIVDWSVPAGGYTLTTTTNVADKYSWVDLPEETARAIQPTSQKLTWIADGLPSRDRGFFAMIKRVANQLQVLMPGETNAPNTTTGKIGTPIAQTVGVGFDVTVNACDASWHVVSSSDTVHFTSSDASATLPGDTALAAGTVTATVYLNTAGSQTVTASDVTDSSKTPGTSSPTTVNP